MSQIGVSVHPPADEPNLNRDVPPMPNDGRTSRKAIFRFWIQQKVNDDLIYAAPNSENPDNSIFLREIMTLKLSTTIICWWYSCYCKWGDLDRRWEQNEWILRDVSIWLALNQLTFNMQKRVYISFGNHRDSVPNKFDFKRSNKVRKRVNHIKYVGITFETRIS